MVIPARRQAPQVQRGLGFAPTPSPTRTVRIPLTVWSPDALRALIPGFHLVAYSPWLMTMAFAHCLLGSPFSGCPDKEQ